MLQFKSDTNYLISARHYLHVAKSNLDISRDKFEVFAFPERVAKQLNIEGFDSAEALKARLRDISMPAHRLLDEISHQINSALSGDIKQHANTLEGHKLYMARWGNKINTANMQVIRKSRTLSQLGESLSAAAQGSSGGLRVDGVPADEITELLHANDDGSRAIERLGHFITDECSELLTRAASLPNYDEFIDSSSMNRTNKLQILQQEDPNSITLSTLASVFRGAGDLRVSSIRTTLAQNVRRELATRFTPDAVKEDSSIINYDRIARAVTNVVENAYAEISSLLVTAIRNSLQGEDYEIGEFINRVVRNGALRIAFSFSNVRSSVLAGSNGIDSAVNGYLTEELQIDTKSRREGAFEYERYFDGVS